MAEKTVLDKEKSIASRCTNLNWYCQFERHSKLVSGTILTESISKIFFISSESAVCKGCKEGKKIKRRLLIASNTPAFIGQISSKSLIQNKPKKFKTQQKWQTQVANQFTHHFLESWEQHLPSFSVVSTSYSSSVCWASVYESEWVCMRECAREIIDFSLCKDDYKEKKCQKRTKKRQKMHEILWKSWKNMWFGSRETFMDYLNGRNNDNTLIFYTKSVGQVTSWNKDVQG